MYTNTNNDKVKTERQINEMVENWEGKTEESECLVQLMDVCNMVTEKKNLKRLKYTNLYKILLILLYLNLLL